MFTFYLLLKFIHIAAAITAVGANVTYVVWNVRAQQDAAHMGFALKGIQFLDNRIANPAYGVVLVTGLLMVFVGRWSITSLWILAAVVLYVVVAVVGVAVYSPVLKNQIRLADAGDTSSPEFVAASRRSAMVGPILGLVVAVILVMMVFKPTL
ncbi:MAG TPA: DUF2269 family protein [Candidatus Dormibacteraeota bacterium]